MKTQILNNMTYQSPPPPDYKAIARRQRRKLAERVLLRLIGAGISAHDNAWLVAKAVDITDLLTKALRTEPQAGKESP